MVARQKGLCIFRVLVTVFAVYDLLNTRINHSSNHSFGINIQYNHYLVPLKCNRLHHPAYSIYNVFVCSFYYHRSVIGWCFTHTNDTVRLSCSFVTHARALRRHTAHLLGKIHTFFTRNRMACLGIVFEKVCARLDKFNINRFEFIVNRI